MERSLRRVLGHNDDSDPAVEKAMAELIERYPADLGPDLREDAARMKEQATWIRGSTSLLDIGGGFSPFAPLLGGLGAATTVVDTFDHEFFEERQDLRRLMDELSIELVTMDATGGRPLPFGDGSFDAITSFDSLEHWHHSPRRLFTELRRVARPGAIFVLGVPNAVNARKRLAVLLGKTNWSRFEDWYGPDAFLGHVREPVVADLEKMADELGLEPRAIVGRNWLGGRRGRLGQIVTRMVDAPLRVRPSLCANLYLVGRFTQEL
jgi:SAM-dependent methyltransferase